MPTEPLPSLVRARVLEMLREAREAAGSRATYTALVVDESTLRVLSRGVKVSELMDDANAITVVESITTPREARTSEDLASCMDVIYFLTPSVSSVRALIGDYEGRSRMYGGGAHVFFSRSLPAALMDELRASPVVPHLRSLREVNLDFVAIQPHAFSLDAPSALQILYGPWGESRARVVAKYAEQAYTACATLGELAPHVRYARNHPVCKAFANELSRLLEAGSAAQASTAAARRRPRGTVLVLDRSSDPLSPMVHGFSYEALAEAFCLVREGRYRRPDAAGGKEVLLSDEDDVWADLRHRPYEQVPGLLQGHMSAFLDENEAVVRAQRGEALTEAQRDEAVRRQFAFGFVKRREQLKVHEELVGAITGMLLPAGAKSALYEQLLLEQDLVTGRELNGMSLRLKESQSRVLAFLSTPAWPPSAATDPPRTLLGDRPSPRAPCDDRLRLIALMAASQSLPDGTLESLLAEAKLPFSDHLATARGLFYLGLPAASPPSARPLPPAENVVELARHAPRLHAAVAAALAGELSDNEYGEAGMDDCGSGVGPDVLATPRAALVGGWAFRKGGGTEQALPARLIVIMLGGASHDELRCALELGADGRVTFGTTALLTPRQYMESLREAPAPPEGAPY